MDKLKLIRIRRNTLYYQNDERRVEKTPLYRLPNPHLSQKFSAQDQDIIHHAALDNGYYISVAPNGTKILVANKRQHYIYFFVALFALSMLTAIFTSLRYIEINGITLYGNFLFFPLIFASTTIINETYGYYRVRIILGTTTIGLLIMAGLLSITLKLNGTLTDGSSDAELLHLFQPVPRLMALWAFTSLCCGCVNAYLFHRMKYYLRGRALWLRVFVSTLVGYSLFALCLLAFEMASRSANLPIQMVLALLYADVLTYTLYAVCSVPLVYAGVFVIKYKEKQQERALIYDHSLLLDNKD